MGSGFVPRVLCLKLSITHHAFIVLTTETEGKRLAVP